jgi:hypothetical protein
MEAGRSSGRGIAAHGSSGISVLIKSERNIMYRLIEKIHTIVENTSDKAEDEAKNHVLPIKVRIG